jgi:hypothetical protein
MNLLSAKEDPRPIHERWTPECTAILEEFKLRLVAGAHLQNPIRDGRGFTLITDSSEFGWGAMLCQYDDERNLILIDHWSAPHKGYGVHAPAFYNEARAVLEGMERSAHYLATCPRELVVLTDSLSLAFIAQTKGKAAREVDRALGNARANVPTPVLTRASRPQRGQKGPSCDRRRQEDHPPRV